MQSRQVASVPDYVHFVESLDRINTYFWFRGEPGQAVTPLLPKLWRSDHIENSLNQLFRLRAPTFAAAPCPDREAVDQWLFLAQHFGLPTRLLDWTESGLAGLYFALLSDDPVVWILDPRGLNRLSPPGTDDFPLTWTDPQDPKGAANIKLAWGDNDPNAVDLPVAILPTNIHPRMSVQRSCFTVHGRDRRSLLDQLGDGDTSPIVARVHVAVLDKARKQMLKSLRVLGISGQTLFPDLQGLAQELAAID